MFRKVCIVFLLLCVAGCGKSVKMNVQSFANQEFNIPSYKKFATVPVSNPSSLQEKELLNVVAGALRSKGYVYDAANPDFLVVLTTQTGNETRYIPEVTYNSNVYQPGQTTTHSGTASAYGPGGTAFGQYSGTTTSSGSWVSVPKKIGGYNVDVVKNSVAVGFIEWKESKGLNPDNPPFLWEGSASSVGKYSLYEIEPCLVIGLLDDFPFKQGSSAKKVDASSCAR